MSPSTIVFGLAFAVGILLLVSAVVPHRMVMPLLIAALCLGVSLVAYTAALAVLDAY